MNPSPTPPIPTTNTAPIPAPTSHSNSTSNITPIPDSLNRLIYAQKNSEIRKHYFTDEHVIISPKKIRDNISNSANNPLSQTMVSGINTLDIDSTPIDSISVDGKWQVVAIDNKYPTLRINNSNAYGYEEIIIDNTRLEKHLSKLSDKEIASIIAMYKKRYLAIKEINHIDYVQILKNSGKMAGSIYEYQYSQLIATNHIPNRVRYLWSEANNFFNKKYENPISAIVSFENNSSVRVIEENINWISFCPYFSIYPLEVWILPKIPFENIGQIADSSISDLVNIMRKVITKLDKYSIDYNYYFINAINGNLSMQMHIVPRLSLSTLGGYEIANTEHINYIFPEDATKWYNSL